MGVLGLRVVEHVPRDRYARCGPVPPRAPRPVDNRLALPDALSTPDAFPCPGSSAPAPQDALPRPASSAPALPDALPVPTSSTPAPSDTLPFLPLHPMTPWVVVVVLLAALLHAGWNAIAHSITDRLLGFALIGLGGMLAALPLLPVVGPPPREAWPVLLASLVTHLLYMSLLMLSYRTGEFGQVYPMARGTAPWVVALTGIILLGESMPPSDLAGVLVVSAGLTTLVFAGGRPGRAQLPALLAAFATGVSIAVYTVVDAYGVRLTQNPLGYVAWLMTLQGPVFFVVAVFTRRGALPRQLKPVWKFGVLGGVVSAVAYGLVLWAQLTGAVAGIAALRETSIVFAALLGALLFGERFGPVRVAASAIVVTGVLLLTF